MRYLFVAEKPSLMREVEKCYKESISTAVLVCHGGTIGTLLEIFYDNSIFYIRAWKCFLSQESPLGLFSIVMIMFSSPHFRLQKVTPFLCHLT